MPLNISFSPKPLGGGLIIIFNVSVWGFSTSQNGYTLDSAKNNSRENNGERNSINLSGYYNCNCKYSASKKRNVFSATGTDPL